MIILFAIIGKITLIMTLFYISIYIVFIFYVLWIEKTREKEEKNIEIKDEEQDPQTNIKSRERGLTRRLNDLDYLIDPNIISVSSETNNKLTFSNAQYSNQDFLINQADKKMSEIMKKSYIRFRKKEGNINSLIDNMDISLHEKSVFDDYLEKEGYDKVKFKK